MIKKTRKELIEIIDQLKKELNSRDSKPSRDIVNITKPKQAEDTLRESEQRFRDVTENALAWVWEIDTSGKYTYASPACKKIIGYKPEELLKKHFYNLFTPEEQEQLKKAAFEAFADKQPFREFINQNIHKSGRLVWMSTSGTPILDEKGNLLGYRGTDMDITERKQTEELLKEAQRYTRGLIEANLDALVTISVKGKITDVNSATELITGMSRKELIGTDFSNYFTVPDAARKGYQQVFLDGYVRDYPLEIKHRDGKVTPVLYNASVYENAQRNVAGVFAAARDITDRNRAENALKKLNDELEQKVEQRTAELKDSVKKSRLLLESTGEGIFGTNNKGEITFINPAVEKILGLSSEELLGSNAHSLFHHHHANGEEYPEIECSMCQAFPEGKTSRVDNEVLWKKDGTAIPVEYSSTPMKKDNELIGSVIIFSDITDRKEAERALEEAKNTAEILYQISLGLSKNLDLTTLLEQILVDCRMLVPYHTASIQVITDDNFEIVSCKGFTDNEKLIGYRFNKKNDAFYRINNKLDESVIIPDVRKYAEFKELKTEHGIHSSMSVPLLIAGKVIGRLTLDSIEINFYNSLHQKHAKSFASMGAIAIENARLYNQVQESQKIAEAATQTKSDFLARMSHEIRTPMNAIIGMTHLTLQTDLDKKQKSNLKKVHSSGISLLKIINDILDFSKIEAGKFDLEYSEFDLEKVFHDLANVITYKAHEKGLELVIDLPRSVPHILIGDPLRLSQILINLSNNAIKFTKDGEIVIQAELAEKKKGRVKILFSVKDTGIGLTKKQAGRLFKSFSQADVSTTREYGGTGLGLAISKSLTEMMGGEIWIESKKGTGSTFFFTAWFGLGKKQKTKEFIPAVDLRRMKVLVCDDNETSRDILREALEAFTFKVTTVNSGKDTIIELEKSAKDPYELVLMDWNMPEMNGLQTAELIKSNMKIVAPPTIIMVTAYNRDEILSKADKIGLAATLIKPVSYSTLFDTIMEVFGKEVEREHIERETGVITEDLLSQLQGALVLLVEDNEVNKDVAVGMLEAAGIQANIANNGKEAVEMVKTSGKPSKYELVFMDLQMPEMDGYDATRLIRKMKDYKDLPIAAMTADAISGVKEKCMDAGMNDFVTKPIDPAEFYRALLRWIRPEKVKTDKQTTAEPHQKKEIEMEIPEIEGMDIKAGLRRINNNKTLYLNLLTKFSKNYSGFIQELKGKLLEGRTEEAERMVHTIKGVSGNISATDLYNYAVMLNDKLRKQEEIDINKELSRFEKHLTPILESLEKFHKEKEEELSENPEDTVEILDKAILTDRLKELKELLQNSDFDAVEKLKVIEKISGIGQYREELSKINDFISSYEFDEAKKVVIKWIEGI